jgi:hypothetical protein
MYADSVFAAGPIGAFFPICSRCWVPGFVEGDGHLCWPTYIGIDWGKKGEKDRTVSSVYDPKTGKYYEDLEHFEEGEA